MPARLSLPSLTDTAMFSPKILSLSDIFNPRPKTIFRFVSILHGSPRSIRVMVRGEMLASLESSALLIIRDSLISFRLFLLIFKILYYLFDIIIMSLLTFVLQKPCKKQSIFISTIISYSYTGNATDQQFELMANSLIL